MFYVKCASRVAPAWMIDYSVAKGESNPVWTEVEPLALPRQSHFCARAVMSGEVMPR